jgi:hypothetical protein
MKFYIFSNTIAAFESLRAALTTNTVLYYFDPGLTSVMETNTSDVVSTWVLSQGHLKELQPIAYFFKKHLPAKCNYNVYDKEPLAIVQGYE